MPRGDGAALSFAQQRLWVVDRLIGEPSAYNVASAWRIRGPLVVGALQQALNAIVARHETLRTRIVVRDGGPVQVIDAPTPVPLPVTDLSGLPATERDARAKALSAAEARRPFDLMADPFLRARLLQLDAGEHELLLTLHHIASDGWSMGVLHRELGAAYAAFAAGAAPQWAPLPVQYADYAVWQRAWLQGEVLEAQLRYWREALAGVSPLALPTDRPRPPVASYRGAALTMALPRPLMDGVRRLALQERATPFMTLLAAFAVLLARYSGQDDIAVGTPIANRRRPELEDLIGFFVNTLVLRTDLSGSPPVRELLGRVRERALEAFEHQDVPFEKLVEELVPKRDLSRQPLFQVLFVLQNAPGAPLALRDLTVERRRLGGHTAKFDLLLSISKAADGWQARWEYATDLFEAETIARMAAHFEVLLAGIVADPNQRIGQLPLLTDAERRQLLVDWNNTAAAYPRDRGVHQLFDDQAARTPDAVAVACGDRQLTYAALDARANQLAHRLIALGVGPDVPVALCAERSLDLVVGLLGILKAGGAYVPLDPSYPRERLAFMLADSGAAVLLTQAPLLDRLPSHAGPRLCLDRNDPILTAQPATAPPTRVTAKTLAYVIYTSGSTGTPKGILLPHATLVNLLAWHRRGTPAGRVAQFTSISFDVSLQEILYALLSGNTLVVADDETRLDPDRFAAFLDAQAITDLFVPNVVLQYLAQAVVASGRRLRLADVYQAGEALTITPAVQAFFEAHPGCRLHNHYGPAETHVVTAETLPPDVGSWPSMPAIGRPIANTRIHILDERREPVPIGVAGEVFIGGDGLARGYLNRPDLTSERFVPDPFSSAPDARVYRSGDLARYRSDGRIEFLGRLDDQVKIRGFRIEPGEVQSVLADHPSIQQSAVIVREDTPGEPRLVAYVVPADRSVADVEALRGFLRTRLPDYMRPAAYVLLDCLPLTPTGKIDRHALPVPEAVPAHRTFQAPVGEIETALARIWSDVLKIEHIGREDDFFDLGGHSLMAVQVASRIRREFDLEIPLRTIFEHPTVETLALALLHQRAEANPAIERLLEEIAAWSEAAPAGGGSNLDDEDAAS